MKLFDVMVNTLKTEEDHLEIDELFDQFFPDYHDIDYSKFYSDNKLRAWFFAPLVDSNELVGKSTLFFGDIPVALVERTGRKGKYSFKWVSHALYEEVKKYVKGLVINCEADPQFLTYSEKNEEVGEGYDIHSATQIPPSSFAIYEDVKVRAQPFDVSNVKLVIVVYENGFTKVVNIAEIELKFNIGDNNGS